ncbi:MAG: choice-of-anchor V domain-containing protein [Planctomycetota bacterium]
MSKLVLTFVCIPIFLLAPSLANATTDGSQSLGLTGAPGESNCAVCHSGSAPSTGSIQLSGLPTQYEPNATYNINVDLQLLGQKRWGFSLTALEDSGNTSAGVFVATDTTNTQTAVSSASRQYITHTEAGTYNGVEDVSPGWSLTWTAPATMVGPISFYAIGNAANGNNASFDPGDFVYRSKTTLTPIPEPSAIAIIGWVVVCFGSMTYLRKERFVDSRIVVAAVLLTCIGLVWSPTTWATPVVLDVTAPNIANTNEKTLTLTMTSDEKLTNEIVASAVQNSFPAMCRGFLVDSTQK